MEKEKDFVMMIAGIMVTIMSYTIDITKAAETNTFDRYSCR